MKALGKSSLQQDLNISNQEIEVSKKEVTEKSRDDSSDLLEESKQVELPKIPLYTAHRDGKWYEIAVVPGGPGSSWDRLFSLQHPTFNLDVSVRDDGQNRDLSPYFRSPRG